MLTIQFVPYNEIEPLSQDSKIRKLIGIAKENKIVVMEGRLKPVEETLLIQKTMESISRKFKGIEICTVYPNKDKKEDIAKSFKKKMAKLLIGDREGLTIIGPANIVKEIKRNPNKIELLTENVSRRK